MAKQRTAIQVPPVSEDAILVGRHRCAIGSGMMVTRQTADWAASLLRRNDMDWTVPNVGALSRPLPGRRLQGLLSSGRG